MGRRWTDAELADLRELWPTTTAAKLALLLNEKHGYGRTESAVNTVACNLGLHKRVPFWTPERREFLREYTPVHTEREIAEEFERRFGISVSTGVVKSGKTMLGIRSGTHGGWFRKGQVPATKGKKWADYMPPESQERCRANCFAKGNMPANGARIPLGSERVDEDGYTWVKVAERSIKRKNDNWVMKSRLEWERIHGRPVPDGYHVVFANHDRTDFSARNLVAVGNAEWVIISRFGYSYHDAESLDACVKLARLRKGIHAAKCAPRTCGKCGNEFNARFPKQATCDACLGRVREGDAE
jgi:hypothetical protein